MWVLGCRCSGVRAVIGVHIAGGMEEEVMVMYGPERTTKERMRGVVRVLGRREDTDEYGRDEYGRDEYGRDECGRGGGWEYERGPRLPMRDAAEAEVKNGPEASAKSMMEKVSVDGDGKVTKGEFLERANEVMFVSGGPGGVEGQPECAHQ